MTDLSQVQAGSSATIRSVGTLLEHGLASVSGHTVRIAAARDDFKSFFFLAGRDRFGKPLRKDATLIMLCDLIQIAYEKGRHVSLVAPPALGKSTVARMFCAWVLGNNHLTSHVWAAAAETTAEDSVSHVRAIVLSQMFKMIFPEIIPDLPSGQRDHRAWRGGKWTLRDRTHAADAAVEAVAAAPRTEARRVDLFFADDFMTRLVAESEALRVSLCSAFYETWIEGRLAEGGWAWAKQNCWHTKDLGHQLLDDHRFCSIWIGVTADCSKMFMRIFNAGAETEALVARPEYARLEVGPQNGADREFHLPLLLTSQYSQKNLIDLQIGTTTRDDYIRRYRLIAASDADRMIPHWEDRKSKGDTVAEQIGVSERGGRIVLNASDRSRLVITGGMDISSGKRKGDSITFLAKDRSGAVYPLEFHRGNFSVAQTVAILNDAWERGLEFALFYVENNATQDKWLDEVRAYARGQNLEGNVYPWFRRVLPFLTGKNKMDPDIGLPRIGVEVETGEILWPRKESTRKLAHAEAWRLAEVEFAECPRFPGLNATPDSLMSFMFGRCALDKVTASSGQLRSRSIRSTNERSKMIGTF